MRKTFAPNPSKVTREWVFLNAEDRVLGQISAEAARFLMGKNKPQFAPNVNLGDKVVITNAAKIVITGNKLKTKVYQWHTGYPKGLRSEKLGALMVRKPDEVIRRAIKGMLPKNKLQKERMANLYIYEGAEHPHTNGKKEN